jgi:hypothetical protein
MSTLRFNTWQNTGGTEVANSTLGTGKILQVVSTTKTDTFSTTNTSFTDVTGLSVTITPSSTSSKIMIVAQLTHSQDGTFESMIRLSGGNTSNYVGDAAGNRVQAVSGVYHYASYRGDYSTYNSPLVYLDSPATTSATTYTVQVRCGSGGIVVVNQSDVDADTAGNVRGASTISAWEVSA